MEEIKNEIPILKPKIQENRTWGSKTQDHKIEMSEKYSKRRNGIYKILYHSNALF